MDKNKKKFQFTQKPQKGFSVVEVMIATTILAISVASVSTLQSQVYKSVHRTSDRAFAAQKATQMFEELRSFVQSNQEEPLKSLQDYFSNGANEYVPTLTIEKRPDPSDPNNRRKDLYLTPDDPLSDNRKLSDKWKYVRQVLVEPVPSDENARHVTVKIWYANESGNPINEAQPLAVISGILKTNINQTPPTQVYDIYALSLANVSSWWVDVSTLRPIFDRTLDDLAARNPGLEMRRHYVARLGYGRDPFYTPYINSEENLRDTNFPYVYFYPGNVEGTSDKATVKEIYMDSIIEGQRLNDDSTETFNAFKQEDTLYPNTDYNTLDKPYRGFSMSDKFNSVVRYPEEKAIYNRLNSQFKLANPDKPDIEPSLLMLLEGMNSEPEKYRNSMITNLHGELIPFPHLRNYADPAKIPCDETYEVSGDSNHCLQPNVALSSTTNREFQEFRYRNMRVVTHPENLKYGNSDNIRLRVYAYETRPLGQTSLSDFPSVTDINSSQYATDMKKHAVEKISLFIPTNGNGYDPKDPTKGGYLDHPTLNTTEATVLGALSVSKVLGNHRIPYIKRSASGTTNRPYLMSTREDTILGVLPINPLYLRNNNVQTLAFDGDLLVTTTADSNTHTPMSANTLKDDAISGLGRLSAIQSGNTRLIIKVRQAGSISATQQTALEDLRDELIVVSSLVQVDAMDQILPGSDNREIARVKAVTVNSPANGFVTLDLYEALQGSHTAINPPSNNWSMVGTLAYNANNVSLVSRHKDYEVKIINSSANERPFGITTNNNGILINLFDTPTRHQRCGGRSGINCLTSGNNTGLTDTRRLYGQEYIPAPVTGTDFSRDLTHNNTNDVKNTARWEIQLNGTFGGTDFNNRMLTFETRMGRASTIQERENDIPANRVTLSTSSVNTNRLVLEQGISEDGDLYEPNRSVSSNENDTNMRKNPYNVSRTYTWIGIDPPLSEQFQYSGDPRFMPYADAKGYYGYNLAFVNSTNDGHTTNVSGYANFDHLSGAGLVNNVGDDFIRYSRLYVDGLMRSSSIYNSMSGYSNYYHGIGGDMGADSSNTRYDVNKQPFTRNDDSGSVYIENDLVADVGGRQCKLVYSAQSTQSDRWLGIFWQGDMFPDEEYVFWKHNGNLPTQGFGNSDNLCPSGSVGSCNRTGATTYWQGYYTDNIYRLDGRGKNSSTQGAPTFMNGNISGTGDNNFAHDSENITGRLTSVAGSILNRAFNLSLEAEPLANRPFKINAAEERPGLYGNDTVMRNHRNKISLVDIQTGAEENANQHDNTYYLRKDDENKIVSAAVKLERGADFPGGYVLINGLRRAGESSEITLARFSVAGVLQSYLNGNDVNDSVGDDSARMRLIPRVEITDPTPSDIFEGASTVPVSFRSQWLRWDLEKYSPAFPANWKEDLGVRFIFKYSADAGLHWKYLDGTNADNVDGVYVHSKVFNDGSSTFDVPGGMSGLEKTLNWNVSGLSGGTYLLRVEAYRAENNNVLKNGYSYHQVYVTLRD